MPLQVGKPVYDGALRAHRVTITELSSSFDYVTTITDHVDLDNGITPEQFREFIREFLDQASKYFSQKIDEELFIQRIEHTYDGEEGPAEEPVRVSWIPAYIIFHPNRYIIHWKLINTESPPGKTGDVVEMPQPAAPTHVSPDKDNGNPTKQMRKKIRQARLKAAVAKLYLHRLTQKYYEKYGNFSGMEDSESDLSSESDVE